MTSEIFVKVTLAVITICSAIVSAYIVPFIKSKISADDLDKLSYYVSVAVRCAEQIYKPNEWQEKKHYVMEFAKNIINEKLHITLTDQQLDTIVEGIVNEIKHDGDVK